MNILFFLHPGTNSRDIFLDLAAGFRQAGAEVNYLELGPIWQAQQQNESTDPGLRHDQKQELMRNAASIIRSHRIDISIGMWANALTTFPDATRGGEPCTFFDAIDSPHLSFWLDAPHWAHEGALKDAFPSRMFNSQQLLHLINNDGTAGEMSQVLGFSNVLSQPYGVSEAVFRPRPDINPLFDLVFGLGPGDQPPSALMRRELASEDPNFEAIRESQAQGVRKQLQRIASTFDARTRDSAFALFDRLLASQLRDRDVPMLDRLPSIAAAEPSLQPTIVRWLKTPAAFIEATAALREIENWERAFTICWLSHRFKCAVFGSPSLDGWDCRATMLGHLAYREQSAAYASGRLGLNVMRWQDDVGTNIKPFEITASGVPCVMSHRATLDRYFEIGRELITYRNLLEAKSKIAELIGDDAQRIRIADAGRARTLRDHTWTARASSLMGVFEAFLRVRTKAGSTIESKISPYGQVLSQLA